MVVVVVVVVCLLMLVLVYLYLSYLISIEKIFRNQSSLLYSMKCYEFDVFLLHNLCN